MTNIYALLKKELPSLEKNLRAVGADEEHVGQNSSDFERFFELCKHIPDMSGHSLYREITSVVRKHLCDDYELNEANAEALWMRFYNDESVEYKDCINRVTLKYIYADELVNAVDFSCVTQYVRPDKYHADLARTKEIHTEGDKNILAMQDLRELAREHKSVVLYAGRCDISIIREAAQYLQRSRIDCNLLVVFDDSEYLSRQDTLDLLGDTSITLGVHVKKNALHLDGVKFIGRTVLVLGEDISAFKKDVMNIFATWQKNGLCPEKCNVLLEKCQIFTGQSIDK